MLSLKQLKKYDLKRLIIMIVAAVALVGLIIITAIAVMGGRGSGRLSAQSFINSIATYEAMEVAADTKFVTAVDKCLDDDGELMAYAVTGYGEGFCGRVTVRCYFDLKGKTLIGIQVVDQIETVGQGAEIADSPYVQRFEYAKMPVWFYDGTVAEEDMPQQDGTRIDTLTGATVSSNAVVEAVNAAYTYYTESVL